MSKNKYYIKQYIINTISFQEWMEKDYQEIIKDNAIIGYLFSANNNIKFVKAEEPQILNLYCIKRKNYNGLEVSKETLSNAWKLFLLKCQNETNKKFKMIFQNPPIEQWMDTKDNWCKKLAGKISQQFDKEFSEALSDVYYGVILCYLKPDVYMGSLTYIERAIINNILMEKRHNKIDKHIISLSTVIDNDGEREITLEDLLPEEEDISENSLSYQTTLEHVKKLMADTFSPREIDQIINQPVFALSRSLYVKLLRWRAKHNIGELYE